MSDLKVNTLKTMLNSLVIVSAVSFGMANLVAFFSKDTFVSKFVIAYVMLFNITAYLVVLLCHLLSKDEGR